MNKYSETPRIMWRVFEWANDNGIDVTLRRDVTFDWQEYPVLRFCRNGRSIEQAFHPATELSGQLEAIWRRIALDLCVQPLDLSELNENDHAP